MTRNEVLTLDRMPSTGAAFLTAATTSFRRPKAAPQLPSLSVKLGGVDIDQQRLSAYRQICGFEAGNGLPICYPQVMAAAMHIHLMTRKGFPMPLLGLVHVANVIEQDQELAADGKYDINVRTGESRDARLGLEFDLITEFAPQGGDVCWQAVTSILYRYKSGGPRRSSAPSKPPVEFGHYAQVNAPADLGRRYGSIAGDVNPIHLTAWSAKLFGFKRAIAHGMWSLAHSAALLQPELKGPPSKLTVAFKRPFFLPGKAALKFAPEAEGLKFALLGAQRAETHLTGSLS